MRKPDYIPFRLDRFTRILSKRLGAKGIGQWYSLRMYVAEIRDLTISIGDRWDREALEADMGIDTDDLADMLNLAAEAGEIDPQLYACGIIWITSLVDDLQSFYTATKRKDVPKKPVAPVRIQVEKELFQYVPEEFQEVTEFFQDVEEEYTKKERIEGIEGIESKKETDFSNLSFDDDYLPMMALFGQFAEVAKWAGMMTDAKAKVQQAFFDASRAAAIEFQRPVTEAAEGIVNQVGAYRTFIKSKGQLPMSAVKWLEYEKYQVDWGNTPIINNSTNKNENGTAKDEIIKNAIRHARESGL